MTVTLPPIPRQPVPLPSLRLLSPTVEALARAARQSASITIARRP